MEHHHNHASLATGKKILFSVILNAIITLTEIIGGILSNSLSLLSDSFHNLNDTSAILIAYIANRISKKPENKKYTYGYKRYEILAAFVNTLILIGVSGLLFIEGIKKFAHPSIINGPLMLTIAAIGLACNLFTGFLLFKASKNNLNVKAMFVHIASDTLSSVAILIGSLFIIKYHIYILDPIFTLAISGYILYSSFYLIRDTAKILLQTVPNNIDIEKIKDYIENTYNFVKSMHQSHLWTTDGNEIYMETHISLREGSVKNTKSLDDYINAIEKSLKDKFNISHLTIQMEGVRCLK